MKGRGDITEKEKRDRRHMCSAVSLPNLAPDQRACLREEEATMFRPGLKCASLKKNTVKN